MEYRNTKTGAIIDSPCIISGGDWVKYTEEVEEVEEIEREEETGKVEETEEDVEDFDGITVKEIKQELDALGIKYDPRARKRELYDLMFEGR